MSVHLLASIPWAARVWALPFLTALCPSERYAPFLRCARKHKPPVRRARGLIGQVCRWLPSRALTFDLALRTRTGGCATKHNRP